MNLVIIFAFVVLAGVVMIIYLLSMEKVIVWADHKVEPEVLPPTRAQIETGREAQEPWNIKSLQGEFDDVKQQVHSLGLEQKPSKVESIGGFFRYTGYALKLMFQEKEIFTFALLQWAAIGAGYYLWVQMLGWIPNEVWESAKNSDDGSIADLVLWVWSFIVVGLVAYPLSILSSCMGAVHFINRQGRSSSIAECLKIVLPSSTRLWIFTWVDAWITVNQILKRLPKKKDRTTPAERAFSEAMYLAWKVGTIGILPALITGRGMIESCRHSISVVRHKFKDVMKLRLGYSALCWVVGIAAYVGTILFFVTFNTLVPRGADTATQVSGFYFWAGVPIFIAVGIVQVFLRPIYVIASCHIYSDYLSEKQERVMLPVPPSKGTSTLVAFVVLMVLLAVAILYRDQLGITAMLSTPYGHK